MNVKKVLYSIRCNVGNKRTNNEDNFFADGVFLTPEMRDKSFSIDAIASAPLLLAVCDGMGGEENGEVASLTATQNISQYAEDLKKTQINIQDYIDKINTQIVLTGRAGTTLVLACINKRNIACFNIGDSRAYALTKKRFFRVTNDHVKISKSGKRKLTRCIGIGNNQTLESYPIITGRCRLLLCSDGLYDMVAEPKIERILREPIKASEAADLLLKTALDNGGNDNITIIIADIL
jgi:protein phosphatase